MEPYKLGDMEQRLAELIWERAPITTRELTALCAEAFGWQRTTTYTMLRRLCDRELFANRGGTVVKLMERAAFLAGQSELLLRGAFDSSLPQFVAAFMRRKRLTDQEIDELLRLIAEHREEA